MSVLYHENGILREMSNDLTRKVHTYDTAGVETNVRDYTAAENAAANDRVAQLAIQQNRVELRAAVQSVITDMDTERQKLFTDFPEGITNATLNQNPAKYIKTLEQVLRRTTAGVKDLARLVAGS